MAFVDEQIRMAQERDGLDGRPDHGRGRTIAEIDRPFTLSKQNGTALFPEERQKLLQKIAGMRTQLAREVEKKDGSIGAELRWKHSLDSFRRQVRKLNRAIDNYNARASREQFHILTLDPDSEIERVMGA